MIGDKMKQAVNKNDFLEAFRNYDRFDQFGYDALSALFDYLEQYEQDMGEEIELDVISLCCDFTAYADVSEFNRDCSECCESIEDINDLTTYIEFDGGFIVQSY